MCCCSPTTNSTWRVVAALARVKTHQRAAPVSRLLGCPRSTFEVSFAWVAGIELVGAVSLLALRQPAAAVSCAVL
jgi:hypothetical protein